MAEDRRAATSRAPAPRAAGRASGGAYTLLTLGYLLALSLMAATIVCTAWFLTELVARQASNARTINIAGAQRMLSQRLALLAPEVAAQDAALSARSLVDYKRLLAAMRSTHSELTTGLDAPARRTPALSAYYFGQHAADPGRESLETSFSRFIADAQAIADTAAAVKRVEPTRVAAFTAQARGPMLVALDEAVTLHQAAAGAEVDTALRFHRGATVGALLLLVLEAVFVFRPLSRRLARQTRALEHEAHHDALTGVLNRCALAQRIAELQRGRHAMAVLVIDIDWFRQTNDSARQAAGDAVLKVLADRLRGMVRTGDLVGPGW